MFAPTQPFGRALRLPLRLLPKTTIMPVLAGANRGLKWIVGAGTHGCWLGRYERREIARLLCKIRPDMVVWDIGAHAGYVTMACARRCRHVVACEASNANVGYLRRHIAINGIQNVSVIEAAIAREDGATVTFGSPADGYQGRIGGRGATVITRNIDALVASGLPPPGLIKMDIEGGESEALVGALETLRRFRPTILLAVHSPEQADTCHSLLQSLGYKIEHLNSETFWCV